MEHNLNQIILLPIFIVLMVIIFHTVKESFKIDVFKSVILSVAVSLLATIALNSNYKGVIGVMLLPYAGLGICILLAVLISFLFKTRKKAKDRCRNMFDKTMPHNTKMNRKTTNDRIQR